MTTNRQAIRNSWQKQIYVTGPLVTGDQSVPCGDPLIADGFSGSAYNGNGFDRTITSAYSLFTYSTPLIGGTHWQGIGYAYTPLVPGIGVDVNVRGDRNSTDLGYDCNSIINNNTPPRPNAVTLQTTGKVSMGDITAPISYDPTIATSFSLLGNPYPCPIDFALLSNDPTADNSGNTNNKLIYQKLWTKNPKISPYTTWSQGIVTNTVTNEPNSSYNGTNGSIIASGQSFLVQTQTTSSNPQIVGNLYFRESYKKPTAVIPDLSFFAIANNKHIRVGLKTAGNKHLDEVVVRLNDAGTKSYNDDWDAQRLNALEDASPKLMTLKGKYELAIATRPDSLLADTAQLGVSNMQKGAYRLSFSEYEAMATEYTILLRDKYLGVAQDVAATADYNFNITADTGSMGNNRFELVFAKKGTTTVTTETVVAKQQPLTIYPNPVSDKLTINGLVANKTFTASIFTVLGKKVLANAATVSGNGATMAVKGLASGVYLLELVSKDGERKMARFVKK